MVERITISFEMDKEDILNMLSDNKQEPYISKAFEEFLKNCFSSYIEIHVRNIRNNMNAMKKVMELTPEQRALAGKLGREKMEKEFDKKKVVDMTVSKILE